MGYNFISATTTGPVRANNQDNFWVGETVKGELIAVIADGMGGLSRGEEASKLVCEAVRDAVRRGSVSPRELENVVKDVNDTIYESYLNTNERSGSTCTLLYLNPDGEGWGIHVGDSRLYLGSQVLTDDHTAYNKFKAEGRYVAPMETARAKSTLTRSVGVEGVVKLDYIDGIKLNQSKCALLASDGFWRGIGFEELCRLGEWNGDSESGVLDDLIANNIRNDESDNQTAVLIKFV